MYDYTGFIAIGLTILSSMVCGSWWMAKLHSLVKENGRQIKSIIDSQARAQEHARGCDADRVKILTTINAQEKTLAKLIAAFEDHEQRITKTHQRLVDHIEHTREH